MGMFDWVNFEMDCPKCGSRVDGFQSKDSHCDLEKIDPDEISTMYSNCPSCDNWIELSRNKPARDIPFSLEEVKALGFCVIQGS